ncbi:MAG: rod shape-determining protein MreC [Candidatus Cryptobacteroides sp.]
MQRRSNPIAAIFTVAVFLCLEAAALFILHRSNEIHRSWFGGIGQGVMKVLWGGGETVRDYFRLRSCNDSLALENFRLMRENARLNAVLDRADVSGVAGNTDSRFSYTGAYIVKISNNRQHNYIILDKGSADGVVEGSGIITPKGVVGIVEAVSENYSYAISLLNRDMNVSARLRRDGPVGPLTWNGHSNATLREIPHHLMDRLGDTVYSSGFSTIFPKDVPIGVTVDARLKDGATWEMDVKLFEDFSRLKYVTIVTNLDAAQLQELEKEGANEQD